MSERHRLMWFYHYQRESSKRTFQLTSGRGTTLLNNPSKFEISMQIRLKYFCTLSQRRVTRKMTTIRAVSGLMSLLAPYALRNKCDLSIQTYLLLIAD